MIKISMHSGSIENVSFNNKSIIINKFYLKKIVKGKIAHSPNIRMDVWCYDIRRLKETTFAVALSELCLLQYNSVVICIKAIR